MARVMLTANLRRYAGGRDEFLVPGATVGELLRNLDAAVAGLRAYLVNEQGSLRRHVNIFIDGKVVEDRAGLSDLVGDDATVHVMQALSGG